MERFQPDRAPFIRLLSRLEGEHGDRLPGFLSTHPRASRTRALTPGRTEMSSPLDARPSVFPCFRASVIRT
jgi:hypothetical protein